MKVAVIGAGPSGLVTLKYLLAAHEYLPISPIEARIFDKEAMLGGMFSNHAYEDLEMVSSKYLTAFSDFRLPADAPDFLSAEAYSKYLADYAHRFGLERHIFLNHKVKKVQRQEQGHTLVISKRGDDGGEVEWKWSCDAVAICSSVNGIPHVPDVEGVEHVPIVMHSSHFRRRDQIPEDACVLILGAGETAMDIAHLAITGPAKSVTICHRQGFMLGPKVIPRPVVFGLAKLPGSPKPIDTSTASLFDTAYVPPALQHSNLLWEWYDKWIKAMHFVISGTGPGVDQWQGQLASARRHVDSAFFVKSLRALPYISNHQRSTSLWNRIRSFIFDLQLEDTHGRRISIAPWPKCIDTSGCVRFRLEDISELLDTDIAALSYMRPDILVFATGYKRLLPFLEPGAYPNPAEASIHGVYREGDVSVGFIGFVRPSVGAIPPLAELQAQFWILRLVQEKLGVRIERAPNAVAPYELDYALRPRGGRDPWVEKGGVDHESYAYQLAVDMGSAPTISYMLRRPFRVWYTWAMGSNFNTKFRLIGPWKWEANAERIMATELFGVVKRTDALVFFMTYTVIPLIFFGFLSVVIYIATGIIAFIGGTFSRVRIAISSKH